MREITISSPNWSQRGNGLLDVFGVILHHTVSPGTSAVAIAKMFAQRSSGVSAHVVIGDDGFVVHCVPILRAAWQAGPCRRYDFDRDGHLEGWESAVNTHTIGIEFCNMGDGRDTFPDAQLRAAATLIRRWDARCLNLRLRDITDHETVSLSGKVDLRANFPAARLFWMILHPRMAMPAHPYPALPAWAKRQVDEIVR